MPLLTADPVREAMGALVRRGLRDVAFAVVFMAVGLGALALSAALGRRRAERPAVASLGLFAALYGLRLFATTGVASLATDTDPLLWSYLTAFITYVIPVPGAIFFEQFMSGPAKIWVRRVWALQIVYAATAIAVDLVLRRPGAAMGPNPFFVLLTGAVAIAALLRPGPERSRELQALRLGGGVLIVFAINENLTSLGLVPWTVRVEPIGFAAFLGCLAYAVAVRFFARERQLVALEQELATARRIQASILPRSLPQVEGLALAVRYVPLAAVAGDFYDFVPIGERRLGVLVADVSGHGVPAALIASMLKVALQAQAAHADQPSQVLTGINQIFCGQLEGQFITAAYLCFDRGAGRLSCAVAGHPPPLLWRAGWGEARRVGENGLLLGHFRDAVYPEANLDLEAGDRVVLYTDGIVEASRPDQEMFGEERLKAFARDHSGVDAESFATTLLDHLEAWSGRGPRRGFDDDLTLAVVDVSPAGGRVR